jgi:hypothetical protein
MAREGLRALSRAGALLAAAAAILIPIAGAAGGPPQERESVATSLEVQKALQLGRELVVKGNYEAAVHVLEEKITCINGSREYLAVLREAYRGRVKELRLANKDAEAEVYNRRLLILDPGAALDGATARATAPQTQVAQTPTKSDSPPPKPLFRLQSEQDAKPADQFQQANTQQARQLLDQAEQEYAKDRFLPACKLYEQAYKTDRAATADCLERWGYCKLFAVVERMNHPPEGGVPYGDLEREVRLAMSLAPAKLEGAGQDLLRRIQERRRGGENSLAQTGEEKPPTIAVQHQERSANGWAVAETANFRVYHNQPRELAEKAAQVAERTRTEMLRKWFAESNEAWPQKCELFLHATAQDYAQATGVPPNSPGHSEIRAEGTRVLLRRLHVHCDNPNMLIAVLPHETTHCVLAGKFGDKPVPRWADEGMAVLTEPREQIDRHLRNLPKHSQERHLFYLRDLMRLDEYPEPRRVGAFYAQSVSIVEFLSKQKGPPTFARFLADGMQGSYEEALRRHFGYQDFNDLEQRWRAYAFQANNSSAGVASRNP